MKAFFIDLSNTVIMRLVFCVLWITESLVFPHRGGIIAKKIGRLLFSAICIGCLLQLSYTVTQVMASMGAVSVQPIVWWKILILFTISPVSYLVIRLWLEYVKNRWEDN